MNPVLENILRGMLGMGFLIFVCYLLSNNRKAINWKLVGIGVVAQICFALGVLKVNFVKIIFQKILPLRYRRLFQSLPEICLRNFRGHI